MRPYPSMLMEGTGSWCGLDWSGWRELTPGKLGTKGMPLEPGVYMIRAIGDDVLFIGHTRRGLQSHVRNVRHGLIDDVRPQGTENDWHGRLWDVRHDGVELEFSFATTADEPEAWRLLLVWQHRMARYPLLLNHPDGLEIDPLVPCGSLESERWMGLSWSPWDTLERPPRIRGLARVAEGHYLALIVHGDLARELGTAMRSRPGLKGSHFSLCEMPAASDRELSILWGDLMGAYVLEFGGPPTLQFVRSRKGHNPRMR